MGAGLGGMKILYIFLELITKLDFSLFFLGGGGGWGREQGMISIVNCPFRVFYSHDTEYYFGE